MTCYYCARPSGHEAECPTGGVYAKIDAKAVVPAGLSAGLALSDLPSFWTTGRNAGKTQALGEWQSDNGFSWRAVPDGEKLYLTAPQPTLIVTDTVTGSQSWTLAFPERKSVILSGEEFEKLQAKAKRVDALEAELKENRREQAEAAPIKMKALSDFREYRATWGLET